MVECKLSAKNSAKDIVCGIGIQETEYKADILIVVIKDLMQIIYSNDSNDKDNIEYITMDCDYAEVKKTDENKHIIRCIIT